MKRIISLILAVSMLSAFIAASAVEVPVGEDLTEILNAMKIMTYDSSRSFNESGYVTRAALAKIMISASGYKGFVAPTSTISPFRDVPFTHWGAPYITVASQKGYMTGYSDGSFRPNANIKYEEAVSAMLKLLGYTNEDYSGGYPYGQLAAAQETGITENLDLSIGSPMTRLDMAKLIYNVLNTNPKNEKEKLYVETLGYTLTSESLILSDILKINTTGPIVIKSGKTIESLGLNQPTVFRNGAKSSVSEIKEYDVVYYSRQSNTVWVYTRKVTGLLGDVLPNKEAPTSVIIDGKTYDLPHYSAQKAFGLDGLEKGRIITALLDKNGQICDAYLTDSANETELGVVINAGTKTTRNNDGTSQTGYYVSVLLLSGNTVDIDRKLDSSGLVGKAVKIDFKTNSISSYASVAGSSREGGFVSASGLKWGSDTPLSKDIKILEVDDNGGVVEITLDRLDGVKLNAGNVLLTSRNPSGVIEGMIIKDVTRDSLKYGYVTSISKSPNSSSYTYQCVIDGAAVSATSDKWFLDLTEGPAVLAYKSGKLDSITNLKRTKNVGKVYRTYLETVNGEKYRISNNVLVYRIIDNKKIDSDIDTAMTGDYIIWAYFDRQPSEGGQIRIIYLK